MTYGGLSTHRLLFRTLSTTEDGSSCRYTMKLRNPKRISVKERKLKNQKIAVTISFIADPPARRRRSKEIS